MFYMDILPLSDLIKAEMERRNISIREFADLVGSTHPTIASILDGRVPSYKTCTQLVPVLRQPLTVILRAATLLPPVSENTEFSERLQYILEQLPDEKKRALISFGLYLLGETDAESPS